MVQKQGQKLVQAKSGGSKVGEDHKMPQYMSKSPSGTGYLFRRSVPADVRSVIGKSEFKVALGGNHRAASQRCRELAVETDRQIESARARVTMQSNASGESERVIAQTTHSETLKGQMGRAGDVPKTDEMDSEEEPKNEGMQNSKWLHALRRALARVQAATKWPQCELATEGTNVGMVVVRKRNMRRRPEPTTL